MSTALRAAAIAASLSVVFVIAGCAGTGGTAATPIDQSKVDKTLQAMLPKGVVDAGTLTVASDIPTPPFDFYGDDGTTVVGLDPDLASAIGELLGVRFEFVPVAYDTLLPSMKAGKYQIAMTGMTDTKERQQQVTFVDYLQTGGGFVIRKGGEAVGGLADLCGKSVGTQSGTIIVDFLEANVAPECPADSPLDLQQFTGQDDVVVALRSDRIGVAVLPSPSAGYLVQTTGDEFDDTFYLPYGVLGFATSGDDADALAKALKGAMDKLVADGTYAKLLDRYGLGSLAVEKITINGAEQ